MSISRRWMKRITLASVTLAVGYAAYQWYTSPVQEGPPLLEEDGQDASEEGGNTLRQRRRRENGGEGGGRDNDDNNATSSSAPTTSEVKRLNNEQGEFGGGYQQPLYARARHPNPPPLPVRTLLQFFQCLEQCEPACTSSELHRTARCGKG